jgi:hypothetical protein
MKLHDHLKREKISIAAWGRRMNPPVTRSQMRRYVLALCTVPERIIVQSYVQSGGKVMPNDWFKLPSLGAPKGRPDEPELPLEQAA